VFLCPEQLCTCSTAGIHFKSAVLCCSIAAAAARDRCIKNACTAQSRRAECSSTDLVCLCAKQLLVTSTVATTPLHNVTEHWLPLPHRAAVVTCSQLLYCCDVLFVSLNDRCRTSAVSTLTVSHVSKASTSRPQCASTRVCGVFAQVDHKAAAFSL
jgi:hypothetical protein